MATTLLLFLIEAAVLTGSSDQLEAITTPSGWKRSSAPATTLLLQLILASKWKQAKPPQVCRLRRNTEPNPAYRETGGGCGHLGLLSPCFVYLPHAIAVVQQV